MSRRHQQESGPLRFRTSSAPAPAALFANNNDATLTDQPPPARINAALSGWLQDRFSAPLPLASLSSSSQQSAAAAAATAGGAPAQTPNPNPTANLCFELAAAGSAARGGKKGTIGDGGDDDDDGADYGLVGNAVGAAARRDRAARLRLAEAPDRAVAALEGVKCGGCAGPVVPSPGETSQARRRRAAALTRVCAGCRRAYHAPCAGEVGALLGGRVLLRLAPGAPPPWEGAGGGLLGALTGQKGRSGQDGGGGSAAAAQQQQQRRKKDEGVTEELERLLREEEVVQAAVARDGHWFHSFPCARVAAALAAQAAIGPVAIDPAPAAAAAAAAAAEGAAADGDEAAAAAPAAAAAAAAPTPPAPFAWLKSMREAAMARLAVDDSSEEFAFDSEADDVDDDDVLPPPPSGARGRTRGRKNNAPKTKPPQPEIEIQPRPGPPPPTSRTWALVDLSRLRAEPGDPVTGRRGAGARLRPDVDALIDVLMQSYGPGAADEIVGLTAAALAAEQEEQEEQERRRASAQRERERAAAAAAGGAAAVPPPSSAAAASTPARPRRRLGGGLRDGRYAVLLRDPAEKGAAPLCAALLESYGPDAAVVGLLATRLSRRGEGHAAALLDATADFARDALGARRLLAAGVPAAADPVCAGLFLGKGGEAAVKREQERVRGELRRQKERDGGGLGAEGPGDGGAGADLVGGLLAVMGSPSLAPYVSKDAIFYSPPHEPRFRRLRRNEAAALAESLPALGRRLEAGGALKRRGVFGWIFGGRGGGAGRAADGSEWLVKDL